MAPSPTEHFRPLRREEYDKLVELGAFEGEHIELLEGQLVRMSPTGPPHSSTVTKLTAMLIRALEDRAVVRTQNPFAALDLSEPEPDVAVVPPGEYDTAHPDQAHLIIEVAESSLAVDRGIKQRLYAACAVPEYWIVNLLERRIEVYTEPVNGAYTQVRRVERDQTVRPLSFPDLEMRAGDFLK